MKKIFILLSALCFLSCTTVHKVNLNNKHCNENISFKNEFFNSINKIEDYVLGKGDKSSFNQGIRFLSKYVHISFNEMLNYDKSYTNYAAFKKDKEEWLKWYEDNKYNIIVK